LAAMCPAERFVVREKFFSAETFRYNPPTSFSCKPLAYTFELHVAEKNSAKKENLHQINYGK